MVEGLSTINANKWSNKEFAEASHYGKMYSIYAINSNIIYIHPMFRKKDKYYINTKEQYKLTDATFGGVLPEEGDLLFISKDKAVSLFKKADLQNLE